MKARLVLTGTVLTLWLFANSYYNYTEAQEPLAQIDRPTWKVGDRWVQALQRGSGLRGREVSTVEKISDFEGAPAYFLRFETEWTDNQGKKRVEQFTKIRDLTLTPIAIVDDHGKLVFRWRSQWLKWPLVAGESWEVQGTEEPLTRTGWSKLRTTGILLVKGAEEVTTPAGTFMTLRVQTTLRRLDEQGQSRGHSVEDDWISPQVRIWVKYSFRASDGSEDGEVVEYHPAP